MRLQTRARELGLQDHVRFVGRLDADTQADLYRRARWFLSLPQSDSVSVSVLEAMAHGCVPILSDLPANRELVRVRRQRADPRPMVRCHRCRHCSRCARAPKRSRCATMPGSPNTRCSSPACSASFSGCRSLALDVNILLINHYAGTPALGMEFRPYYLAREWVRAGHRVQILAADFSHVRACQPSAGDEMIDGIAYRWIATPRYQGNGFGRVRNIWAFLRAVWADTARLGR